MVRELENAHITKEGADTEVRSDSPLGKLYKAIDLHHKAINSQKPPSAR